MGFDWDPSQYGRFSDHRLRPALELLQRVEHDGPRLVADLGCGRGEMARIMAERWPTAAVTGLDLSSEMLAEAAAEPSRVRWELADIRDWEPDAPPDLIYSNAALHWVDDHPSLFRRLAELLAPGGVLAVQMPLSWYEPSHRLLRETLVAGHLGSNALRRRHAEPNVHHPAAYAAWLEPITAHLDIWETRYHHVLSGPDPVLEWVKGSILRPAIDELDEPELDRLFESYGRRLRAAYPPSEAGTTVYPFPRLFIVARR